MRAFMFQRTRVLGLLFLLSVITYLDRVCISVAGPRMQAELGISPSGWGWVVGVFTIGYALFEIPSGVLADRIGARSVLTRIVLWWSVFTSLTGAVSGFGMLLVVRFCFGAGEAGAYPSAASAISRWFPTCERSRATGVVWMASRVGGILSPILVVPIQKAFGWRAAFWAFGVLGAVWAVVWYRWYRDRPSEKAGITKAELDSMGGGAGSSHHALPWRHVMKKANFWKLLVMYHTYCWGSFFYLSWLHTYLQKGRGFSEDQMKIWSVLPFALGACANFVGGTLSDKLVRKRGLKFGRRLIGVVGLALGAFFLTCTALTPKGHSELAAVFLAVGYMSMDFFLPVSWAVAMDIGRANAGGISGAMNMAGQLGSFMSSVLFGYIVEATGSYDQPLFLLAGMTVVSAILFFTIDPTEPVVDEGFVAAAAAARA